MRYLFKEELFLLQVAKDELKNVIGELSKLKYEMQTNKPLTRFESDIPDTKIYDWYLSEQTTSDGEPKYFTAIWLLVECYMYRKIRFIFENTYVVVCFIINLDSDNYKLIHLNSLK